MASVHKFSNTGLTGAEMIRTNVPTYMEPWVNHTNYCVLITVHIEVKLLVANELFIELSY